MVKVLNLILSRKEIRCPEIIRCYPGRDPAGRQSEVGWSEASLSSETSALGQELLLGYLRYLVLLFFWSF